MGRSMLRCGERRDRGSPPREEVLAMKKQVRLRRYGMVHFSWAFLAALAASGCGGTVRAGDDASAGASSGGTSAAGGAVGNGGHAGSATVCAGSCLAIGCA